MTENKITLGQLANVLTESGIDLGTIYLDEKQVQQIQDDLTEEQQTAIARTLSLKTEKLTEIDLDDVSGGSCWDTAKKWLKRGAKVAAAGAGLISGGLLLASKLTDDIDIGVAFGKYTIIDPNNKWTQSAQYLHNGNAKERKNHQAGTAFTKL